MSITSKSTVLVTGASGFIGSHLVRRLRERGAKVIATDRKAGEGVTAVDVTESMQIESVFKGVDFVFHLAGQKSASLSREHPVETLKAGIDGTLHLLEAARKQGSVRKLVLISSLAVYGQYEDGRQDSLCESNPVRADSIYSASKLAPEQIGAGYWNEFQLPVTIARLANVYGPGQSEAALIPGLVRQMKNQSEVWMGNDASVRDFIHVTDVVEALIALAEHPNSSGQIFNVGTGVGTTTKTIVEMLSRILNFHGEVRVDASRIRENEKKFLVADVKKIFEMIGWKPTVTLETGLKEV